MLIGATVLALMAWVMGVVIPWLAFLVVPVLIWLFLFFRDPHRVVPGEQSVMVSPADGKVSDINEIASEPLLGGEPAVRVGIFLSVFNVHVNRSPCDGKVLDVKYKKGKFINAMRHSQASDENESNTAVLGDPVSGKPVAVVKQIVGLIARRIVFTPQVGQTITRGQRIGMIKFGSRTELVIPKSLEPEIVVKIGQMVRGGSDIIARLGKPVHTSVERVDDSEAEAVAPRHSPA